MRIVHIALLCMALSPFSAFAAPACYEQAAVPAHGFAFVPSEKLTVVTGLTMDGSACASIAFWQGNPVVEQKIHAPFRRVYEAYATAIERGDRNAARRIYTWLRPTPRDFPQWAELFSVKEGPPMPWGMPAAIRIVRMLQPDSGFEKNLLHGGDPDLPVLNMQLAWPVLFLLMGGEVHPSEAWVEAAYPQHAIESCLGWRCPLYAIESKKLSKSSTQLRLR